MSQQLISITQATALKRCLAFIYDLFLMIPLMMLVTLIWLFFNNGVAIEPGHPLYFFSTTSQILTPISFYAYFWYKGGQTLGMRSWRIRIISKLGDPLAISFVGNPLTKIQSIMRAILTIGSVFLVSGLILTLLTTNINLEILLNIKFTYFLLIILACIALFGMCQTFTKRRTSLVDLLTQTRIVQLPKVEKPKK